VTEKQKKHVQIEKRYVLRDRREVWANLHMSLLRNAGGKRKACAGWRPT